MTDAGIVCSHGQQPGAVQRLVDCSSHQPQPRWPMVWDDGHCSPWTTGQSQLSCPWPALLPTEGGHLLVLVILVHHFFRVFISAFWHELESTLPSMCLSVVCEHRLPGNRLGEGISMGWVRLQLWVGVYWSLLQTMKLARVPFWGTFLICFVCMAYLYLFFLKKKSRWLTG